MILECSITNCAVCESATFLKKCTTCKSGFYKTAGATANDADTCTGNRLKRKKYDKNYKN